MLGIIDTSTLDNSIWTEVRRNASLGWEIVELFGGNHREMFKHRLWDCLIRQAVICGAYSFLKDTIVALCFRYVVASVGVIHNYIQIVCNHLEQRSKLVVGVDFADAITSLVVHA